MKKRWIAVGTVIALFVMMVCACWLVRPIVTDALADTVTTSINEHINGKASFSSMDISLSGAVTLKNPVIVDVQGKQVVSGNQIDVAISPLKAIKLAAGGGNIVGAIETVSLDSPTVDIWENNQKQWNVATLIKQSSDTSDPGFRAAIRVHDGIVRAKLADGTVIKADSCEGSVDFAKYPMIYGDVSATIDGKHISASGHYRSSRDYDAALKADAIKVAYVSEFIPAGVDVTIQGGTLENVKAKIKQSHAGLDLSGQADVVDGAASVQEYKLDSLTGHVGVSTEDVTLDNLSGKVNGQAVSVNGTVVINAAVPVFNLSIKAPSVDIAALVGNRDIPVSGTIGTQVRVWGTAEDLNAVGTVTLPDVDVQGIQVQQGSVAFSYAHQQALIDSFAADVAGGHIEGNGSYNQTTGDFSGSVDIAGVQLGDIPQLPVSILGSVSGTVAVSGNTISGAVQAQGHATAEALSYNGIEAETAEGDFTYMDGVLSIPNAVAAVRGGTVEVSGVYSEAGHTDMLVAVTNLPLDMISAYVSVPVYGTITAAGHITSSEPVWNASFTVTGGAIDNVPFDTISGTVNGAGTRINVPSLTWVYVDGVHQASGYVDLDSRELQASIDSQHMRLEKLLPAVGKGNLPVTGWFNNHVEISGTLDNIAAAGAVQLTDGSAYGYLYKNVSAAYRLQDGTVYLTNGNVTAYQSSISFYGSVGDRLDIHLESPDIDVARVAPGTKLYRHGNVAVSAYIGGTLGNPTAVGTISSNGLVLNHTPISHLKAEFGYYGGIVRVSDLIFQQNGGTYEANGSWNPATGWIMVRASVDQGDLASWLQLADLPLQKISGKIDGKVSIDGTVKNPRGKIQGKLTKGVVDGFAVPETNVDIALDDGIFHINQLALHVDDGLIAAQGTYSLHGPVKLQVGARNFSSKVILDILGKDPGMLDTRIDLAADVSGTGDLPKADVSVQLNGGTINGVPFTNIFGLLNIRDNVISINQATIERTPYKASAYGTIPVAALKQDTSSDASMNVTFKLDNAGLDILTFMTPMVKEGYGGIDGTVTATGTVANPLLNGTISVQDGGILFRDLKNPLENINASIVFKNNNVTIESSGTMDKKGKKKNRGRYMLNGSATWDGWKLDSYNGIVVFDHLGVNCDYFKGPLNGQVNVSKDGPVPKIMGLINIADTTLNVPLLAASSTSSSDAELDVTISLGEKVRLYNPALYDLIVKGSANFRGTISHPLPSGRFEAVKGSIHYLDTKFILSKGIADFSQQDSLMPYMNIEGRSRVGQYAITLTARGPADNMRIILRSQPPLSRQQIISLITLRNGGSRKSSSLTGEDVSSLIGSGVRMTLNSMGITNELERFLTLDMLTVSAGSLNTNERITSQNKNYYNIEMGKYLFNDFMVTAAFGLNHNDNRFGFRYDVNTRFSLEGWRADDERYVGGQYRYTFY